MKNSNRIVTVVMTELEARLLQRVADTFLDTFAARMTFDKANPDTPKKASILVDNACAKIAAALSGEE